MTRLFCFATLLICIGHAVAVAQPVQIIDAFAIFLGGYQGGAQPIFSDANVRWKREEQNGIVTFSVVAPNPAYNDPGHPTRKSKFGRTTVKFSQPARCIVAVDSVTEKSEEKNDNAFFVSARDKRTIDLNKVTALRVESSPSGAVRIGIHGGGAVCANDKCEDSHERVFFYGPRLLDFATRAAKVAVDIAKLCPGRSA